MDIMIIVWLVVAAIMVILEIVSMGLTSIWFAGGALIAAVVSAAGGGVFLQILVFALVSMVLLIATRPFAKKFLNKHIELTNSESLVGKTCKVVETISNENEKGTVYIDGLEWMARSKDGSEIDIDTIVSIDEVAGAKLIVKKI